jgi:hypothetical protein
MKGVIKKDTVVIGAVYMGVALFVLFGLEAMYLGNKITKLNNQLYNSSSACLEDLNNLLDTQPNFYTSDQQQKQYCEGQAQ